MLVLKRNTDILASGALADAVVQRLAINGTVLIEEGECVRADFISIFPRGNHRNNVSFSIWKLHSSEIEAEEFRAMHAQLNTGRADLIWQRTKDGETITLTMANAGWRVITPELTGVSSRTQYECVGGRITSVISAAVGNYIDGGTAGEAFLTPRLIIHGGTAGDGAIFYNVFDGGIAA